MSKSKLMLKIKSTSTSTSVSSMTSRLDYLLGEDQFVYPSDSYLDFITPFEMFNIVIANTLIQTGGLTDKVVWDMFAGIGTDSIRLARHSGRVIATEINKETFQCLKKNVEASGLTNLQAFNRDCCSDKGVTGPQPDVIYFDPPWGDTFQSGQPFSFSDVKLTNGWTVIDLLKHIRTLYKESYLIIKSPYICDVEKFIAEESILSILTFSRQKLKYIIVGPYP